MKRDRWKQIAAIGISLIIFLTLPLLGDIYYKEIYYMTVILLIPVAGYQIVRYEKYEQKFYTRWQKAREQGFTINMAREGLKGFALMIVTVMIGQFFGKGLTPLDIVSRLPNGMLIGLFLMLTAFSAAIGVAAWYGNEKKYARIFFERKREQEEN
jgi:hypothetical protein